MPGTVQVYILTGPIAAQPAASPNNAGVANSALLAKVLQALGADNVRPLTDTVSALAASEIVAALSVPGVYQVVLTQPSYTQLSVGQWANCTAITLAQAIATEHS